MAPAWSSRASCDPAPCRAHRPPWPTSWDCATWPSRSTTCRRLSIGQLPRATGWSVASASTRTLGGWPMSGGRKGSSSHWPSASAEPRNARICSRDEVHPRPRPLGGVVRPGRRSCRCWPGQLAGLATRPFGCACLLPGVVLRGWLVAGEDAVEASQRLVIELQRYSALCILELPGGARSDDRPGHPVLVQQPGERDAARLFADLIAQVFVRLDLLAAVLECLLRPAPQAAAPFALLLEHSAEQTALQRGPRDDADAIGDRSGQDLELNVAGQQVVNGLLADQAEEVTCRCGVVGLCDMPAREVGRSGIQDLALSDQHLHRLPDLIPRRAPVDVMHLVQVDVVGTQPP